MKGWWKRQVQAWKTEMNPFYCLHHRKIETPAFFYTHHYREGEEPYEWR